MGAPVLMIQKNGQLLRSLTLDSGDALLGRGEGCVIRLEDRAVSRQHAVIRSGPAGLSIERKSPVAPLIVNGSECEVASLKEGDEVLIGPFVLRISMPDDAAKGRQERVPVTPDASAPPRSADEPPSAGPGARGSNSFVQGDSLPGAHLPDMPVSGAAPVQEFGGSDGAIAGSAAQPPNNAIGSTFGEGAGGDRDLLPAHEQGLVMPDPAPELSSIIEEDAKTRILPSGSLVKLKLRFSPGAANIEVGEFDQDEISIGRGQGCDIVLNDKKASRKHLVIRRTGSGVEAVFTVRDLESANGVYVNGAKVTDHVLSGDDVIRVGDTEFAVQAVLPNYEQQMENFLKLDSEIPIHEERRFIEGMARLPQDPAPDEAGPSDARPGLREAADPQAVAAPISSPVSPLEGFSNVVGVSGIPGSSSPGRMSLLERYRALPPRSRLIWIAFIGMLVYTLLAELPGDKPQAVKKKAVAEGQAEKKKPAGAEGPEAGLPTFDQLKPDLQKFVDSQYNLALEYFRNRDYDRSLYEVRKIFQYVSDYRDARDLERYSVESKQRVQAQEDERRRKELEEANKAKVAKLIIEVEGHMARKEYVQARELFAEIVAIDPDNPQITGWRKEIETYEEKLERERQLKQLERETSGRAQEIIASGNQALRQRRWSRAIEIFNGISALGIRNEKVLRQARSGIVRAKAGIVAARDPLIAEGRRLEQESAYSEAFKKFAAARTVDPSSIEAKKGMERVRGYLRDRSKQLYTEAVLAESYSDFALAKARFEQLLEVAPPDDPYYERARRKLSRYLAKEEIPR